MSKNVIGIDFGTSTSLIRVKEYNGTNDDMTMDCKAVSMSQDGQVNAPTLIRINGEQHKYGHNATVIGKGILYSNFKILLRSEDDKERQLGTVLIRDFYSYLYKQYEGQKDILFKNLKADTITKVSYPPQWDEAQRKIILNAAIDAGFKNVVGVDEATASVNCVLNTKYEDLRKSGLIKYGKPFIILVIDMGAGTTDLAFVKVTVTEEIKTEILGTWPTSYSNSIYGGCRMDDRFAVFLKKWLTEEGVPISKADKIISSQAPQIKMWKEQTVSAVLEADKSITECSVIENILMMFGTEINPMPELNRTSFEKIFASEIEAFADVVKSAPSELLEQTDIVVLTGGNSAWYWIPEVLCRGDIGLKKIMDNSWRILKTALPNETVARGLIYLPIKFNNEVRKGEKPKEEKKVNPVDEKSDIPNITFPISLADYDKMMHYQNRIAAGSGHVVVLCNDGRVIAVGSNSFKQCDVQTLNDVVAVSASNVMIGNLTFFLFNNGNVGYTGCNYPDIDITKDWENIVAICAGEEDVLGLRRDGAVVAAGLHYKSYSLSHWKNIVAISAGGHHIVGLRSDGTVVSVGENDKGQCDTDNWENIIAISAGVAHTVGLKKDGTVVVTGICGTGYEKWTDIIAVSGWDRYVVGLRRDGSLICPHTTELSSSQITTLNSWKDIIAISAGDDYFVGLKRDGSLNVLGLNNVQQLNNYNIFKN